MIGASVSLAEANEIKRDRSYAEEMFAGLSPDGSVKLVLSSPRSIAFSFMRSMKEAVPPCDTRANDRAAALSEAINVRCSTLSRVMRSLARRYVVDAA